MDKLSEVMILFGSLCNASYWIFYSHDLKECFISEARRQTDNLNIY